MQFCNSACFGVCVLILSLANPMLESASGKDEATAGRLPRLEVSENRRFLVTEDGRPFFYLADTAWELFHRLNREEADRYLSDRAAKGFNVVQAVVLAEQSGLTDPNAYGHLPLIDKTDPTRPATKPGPRNDYWDHVDEIIDMAADRGLYVGLLPTWGKYVTSHWANGIVDGIFNVENAQKYGEFIGRRYRDRTNIVWIIGGDRAAPTEESQEIWRALAKGVAIGVAGSEDYSKVLMTYHTSGPGHASDFFHEDRWLDFTSIQSSHGDRILNWKMIERDYERRPIKPIIDLETTYPDVVIMKGMKPGNDDHARRSAYWSVFSGACGHTYGHNSIWQMFAPGRRPVLSPKCSWYEALDAPSARQMGYLRRLAESRPFLSRVPDQSLIVSQPEDEIDQLRATRGDAYAFVYSPMGDSFRVRLGRISGEEVRAWWFDPRTGTASSIDTFANDGDRAFDPPGEPGVGNDWVLVLDDASKAFPLPGMIATYTNPIGDSPIHMGDPSVIQHEGRYYLFGTNASNEGFKCWESTDLVRWTEKGWACRETESSWAKSHDWAPEVECYRGRFYMTYSANHRAFPHYGIGDAIADDPLGS